MQNNHYFSEKQDNLIDDVKTYKLKILNHDFVFMTNSGVFSKNYIDFGTYTLLNAFIPKNKKILDVGCGYGVIGIVLSKVYDLDVLMIDINNRAVELSKENIAKNKVNAKVIHSNLFENVTGEFDQIVTNPPIRAGKKVVYGIYDKAFDHLLPGGELWVVIQKKQGAPSTISHLQTVFGNCDIVDKKKGYFILKSIKHILTN